MDIDLDNNYNYDDFKDRDHSIYDNDDASDDDDNHHDDDGDDHDDSDDNDLIWEMKTMETAKTNTCCLS